MRYFIKINFTVSFGAIRKFKIIYGAHIIYLLESAGIKEEEVWLHLKVYVTTKEKLWHSKAVKTGYCTNEMEMTLIHTYQYKYLK